MHQRVEQLRDRNRLPRGHPSGEVVALEHAGDRDHPRQPDDLRVAQLREPLAVVAHFGARGVEDHHCLLEIRLGVGVDLVVRQHRALARTARGIADSRRVVADDQDACVPLVLEGAHALQRDRPADVDVRRGDVDPELDAQRLAVRELPLELPGGQDVDGVTSQLGDAHGSFRL